MAIVEGMLLYPKLTIRRLTYKKQTEYECMSTGFIKIQRRRVGPTEQRHIDTRQRTDNDTKESNVTKMRLTKDNTTKMRLALHMVTWSGLNYKNIVTINNWLHNKTHAYTLMTTMKYITVKCSLPS